MTSAVIISHLLVLHQCFIAVLKAARDILCVLSDSSCMITLSTRYNMDSVDLML